MEVGGPAGAFWTRGWIWRDDGRGFSVQFIYLKQYHHTLSHSL